MQIGWGLPPFSRVFADREAMKREVATLPAQLPHMFQVRVHADTCKVCGEGFDAVLHREIQIEKSAATSAVIREKGI